MINPFAAVGSSIKSVKQSVRRERDTYTVDDRLLYFQRDFWVDYHLAVMLLARLAELYSMSDRVRPEGLLITGPSNNGKTSIAIKFMREMLSAYQPREDRPNVPPIVKAEASPGIPSPKAFYMSLLQAAGAPYNARSPEQELANQVVRLFTEADVRMIIIDEIHNALVGSGNQQQALLNTLKSLSNMLQIPVVAIGTEDAKFMFQRDSQIESRFPAFEVSPWDPSEEYAQMVDDMYAAMDPDIPSPAGDFEFIDELHRLSGGLTGATKRLVMQSASVVVRNGYGELNVSTLNDIMRHPNAR